MDPASDKQDKQPWTTFVDPHGFFRLELPPGWEVDQSLGTHRTGFQGKVWIGRTFYTSLRPPSPVPEDNAWRMGISIRIEQYNETPPPTRGDEQFPPLTYEALHNYRVQHDSDWLACQVGLIRLHFQYGIRSGRGSKYPQPGWELPPPLTPDEERDRLALVQRILDSLELLQGVG